jgi:hypothetical protein
MVAGRVSRNFISDPIKQPTTSVSTGWYWFQPQCERVVHSLGCKTNYYRSRYSTPHESSHTTYLSPKKLSSSLINWSSFHRTANLKGAELLNVFHVSTFLTYSTYRIGTNLCVPLSLEVKSKGDQRGSRCFIYCPYYKHYFPVAVLCSSLSQSLCR